MTKTGFRKSVRWVLLIVFLVFGLTTVYPIYRNERALSRLRSLDGDFYSQHHGFINKLPWKTQRKIKEFAQKIHGVKPGNYKWAGRYKMIEGYDLRDTKATEDDLEFLLRGQSSIRWLFLDGAQVSGVESFRHLSDCDMIYINAANAQIEDDALIHLEAVGGLRDLDVRGTKVTAGALPYLIKIPGLENVDLPDTFSEETAEKLRKARPKLRVQLRP